MRIFQFEEIRSWQKAKELTIGVYQCFSDSKDYGIKDQIQRASVSVMNNIAEGFERQTNKEFIRYLYISKGSCGEVRSMLYLAKEFKYITDEEFEKLYNLSLDATRLISAFIKKLNEK
ncbi:four helix bundle protein [Brumimicrobium aurantiacum]|uniref:Four helix bundle protein n=1 Tax=Brumimicrobium aurantiacum TaxID=1737063 RepID=A0A3E1EUR9_9FLAO|nr:four helix bundle protein [Brumimicrobium aurantiacum]RFC53223.1 four helix bundle protein [Brumimicrobium aurantiacum]